MTKEQFSIWYKEHNIFDEVLDALWESFYDYKRENPILFADVFPLERDNVNLDFVKLSHEIILPAFTEEMICVYVDIYTDETCVGWFKQIFDSEGNKQQKYFMIEQKGLTE